MTKSRPALSVKRKQAALRADSKSAASNGNGTAKRNRDLPSCGCCEESVDTRKTLVVHAHMSCWNESVTRDIERRNALTAALAEAEAWKLRNETLKADMRQVEAVMENNAEAFNAEAGRMKANYTKLLADNTALDESRLLQEAEYKGLTDDYNEQCNQMSTLMSERYEAREQSKRYENLYREGLAQFDAREIELGAHLTRLIHEHKQIAALRADNTRKQNMLELKEISRLGWVTEHGRLLKVSSRWLIGTTLLAAALAGALTWCWAVNR